MIIEKNISQMLLAELYRKKISIKLETDFKREKHWDWFDRIMSV